MRPAGREAPDRGHAPVRSLRLAQEDGPDPPAKLRVAEDEPIVGPVQRRYGHRDYFVVANLAFTDL